MFEQFRTMGMDGALVFQSNEHKTSLPRSLVRSGRSTKRCFLPSLHYPRGDGLPRHIIVVGDRNLLVIVHFEFFVISNI